MFYYSDVVLQLILISKIRSTHLLLLLFLAHFHPYHFAREDPPVFSFPSNSISPLALHTRSIKSSHLSFCLFRSLFPFYFLFYQDVDYFDHNKVKLSLKRKQQANFNVLKSFQNMPPFIPCRKRPVCMKFYRIFIWI